MSQELRFDITIPNQTQYLSMIGRTGENIAYSLKDYQGSRRELAYHLNLVLSEALANAICHANQEDPEKSVRIVITASDQDLALKVYDQGPGFDFQAFAERKSKSSDESGRGVLLILKLMDHVEYIKEGDFNVMIMNKKLSGSVAED